MCHPLALACTLPRKVSWRARLMDGNRGGERNSAKRTKVGVKPGQGTAQKSLATRMSRGSGQGRPLKVQLPDSETSCLACPGPGAQCPPYAPSASRCLRCNSVIFTTPERVNMANIGANMSKLAAGCFLREETFALFSGVSDKNLGKTCHSKSVNNQVKRATY